MPINLTQINSLLKPGLMSLTGEYAMWQPLYKDCGFVTRKSRMNTEQSVSMQYVGLPNIKQDGAPVQFDNSPGQLFVYNYQNVEVALAYAITRQAIEDNLYQSQFKPMQLGLQKSFLQFKEIMAANIFNLGTTYNSNVGGDGVALFSTAHPTGAGLTYANRPATDVDLNEASLLNAQIAVRSTFRDNAGLITNIKAKTLVVPPQLEPIAARLIKSTLRPGTNDNDVNVIGITAGGIDKYVVNPYLTSPYAWFVTTDVEGLVHLDRMPFETDSFPDFTTENLLVKARERYTFGYEDPRAAYGSFPSA